MHWLIDGNNVVGAGADGWWNDPVAASARLTQAIAEWCTTDVSGDAVTVVFDGRPEPRLALLAGGDLSVDFARRSGRDAADDRIVELVVALLEPGDDPTAGNEPGVDAGDAHGDDADGDDTDGDAAGLSGRPVAPADVTVVTSDRGLVARLPAGVGVEGAGRFRARLGLPLPGSARRRR